MHECLSKRRKEAKLRDVPAAGNRTNLYLMLIYV